MRCPFVVRGHQNRLWDARSPSTDVIAHPVSHPLTVGITTPWDIVTSS